MLLAASNLNPSIDKDDLALNIDIDNNDNDFEGQKALEDISV